MCLQATASSYRTLRADAERYRLRILDAAGSVFAERALDEAFGTNHSVPLPEPLTRQQTDEAMRYLGQVKRVCPKAVTGA